MVAAGTRRAGRSPVLVIALVLVAAQLVLRGWVATRGYFYWDDLRLVGLAHEFPPWSPELLLHDHDGHFMPLAFVTAWVVTAPAPLRWAGPVLTMLVLQGAAALAVVRMLRVLVPPRNRTGARRWVLLVPLIVYLFGPLTLPAFAWWSAALNALPLQFALAWVIADAVLLIRTGRGRYVISGVVVLVLGLLFFEKAVVVPFVAFAVATLERYVSGTPRAGEAADGPAPEPGLRACAGSVLCAGGRLWLGSVLVLAGWGVVYALVVGHTGLDISLVGARRLLHSATSLGVVPTMFGGPWVWERWLPSTPWAAPPHWVVGACWAGLAVLAVVSSWLRRRVLPLWLLLAGYVLAVQVPVILIRGGPNTAAELMQSLRYLADIAVVIVAAAALLLRACPRTERVAGLESRRWVRVLALVATVAFLVSSLYTTVGFTRSWQLSPTRTYFTNVRAAWANWDGTPLLEQEVPWMVLTPMVHPGNLISSVLAPIAPPGAFATSTPRLRMITDDGRIVDASVWWNRRILAGPEPGCGYRIDGARVVALWLDGPMLAHGWTAQLNYFADRDGRITVSMEHGDAVTVPVRGGANTVFVHLVGSGQVLRIGSHTPGLNLCVGVGPVGVAAFGR
ncbi:MAG: hypothetical protein J2P18_16545 [Nocardia sp.]|nr:hypothetical protein [Nocardia sp.]